MSNELTVIAPKSLGEAKELSQTLSTAHTLPQALQKAPADVLAIILTGAELGLAPMQAIRGLAIIKGKPVLSADAMGALVKRRRDTCEYLVCVETTAQVAKFETKRAGDPKPTTLSFTIEQAKAAGLTGGDNWRKYPEAMLRARALSGICRLVYPDLLLGVYDPDELAEPGPQQPPPEKDITPAPEPVTTGTRTAQVKAQLAARVGKPVIVDVKPGESEAEAIARTADSMTAKTEPTPFERIKEAAKERGFAFSEMPDIIKNATGKQDRKALTDDDVSRVVAALDALRQMEEPPLQDEPPHESEIPVPF